MHFHKYYLALLEDKSLLSLLCFLFSLFTLSPLYNLPVISEPLLVCLLGSSASSCSPICLQGHEWFDNDNLLSVRSCC